MHRRKFHRSDNPTCTIECLESRIAPAGLVQVAVVKGVLQLTGDGEANGLTVEAMGPDFIVVSSNDDTMISFGGNTGVQAIVTQPILELSSDLGANDDALALVNLSLAKNIALSDSAGANSFTFSGVRLGGNLTLTGGTGADTVTFNTKVFAAKGVNLALGEGDNSVTLSVDTFSCTSFKMEGGAGVDTIAKSGGDWDILGAWTLSLGDGANSVNLSGGTIAVNGPANITHGSHAAGTTTTNLVQNSALFKSTLTISYVDGTNMTNFSAFDFAGKNSVKVNGGTGADRVGFTGSFSAKSLALHLGDGADTISLTGTNVTVSGLTDYALGEGGNSITGALGLANYNGGLKVTGGSGSDSIDFGANVLNLPKGATLDGGAGADTIGLRGSVVNAAGPILLKNGAHPGGASSAFFSFNRIAVQNVTASFGEGPETVTITGTSDTTMKALTITAPGAGATTIDLIGASFVAGKMTVTSGNDGLNFAPATLDFLDIGALKVTGGTGTDTVKLKSGGRVGALTLALGTGSSVVELTGQRGGLAVTGALTISTVSAAAETDALKLSNLRLAGVTKIAQGAGVGTVKIDDVVTSAFTLDTKEGADKIDIETDISGFVSVFNGPVSILLGAGANVLNIGSLMPASKADFRGKVKFVGGPDADTYNDNGSIFLPGQPVKVDI